MPIRRVIASSVVVALLGFLATPAGAQTTPPWPDGCSVGLPLFIQNGLDRIFFAACTHHDFCWARCNPPGGPYLGLSHKFQCDGFFLAEMEAACAAWAVVLSFPGSGWSDSGAFFEDCSAVAATFATAVGVTPAGLSRFWQSQCERGCNLQACALAPSAQYCSRSNCTQIPPPIPPPPEPEDPCIDPYGALRVLPMSGEPRLATALPGTSYPLTRTEDRDGFRYLMEEWAVLATATGDDGRGIDLEVASASSSAYGLMQRQRLASAFERGGPAGGAGMGAEPTVLLTVHAPVHRRDHRWIPTPVVRLAPARAGGSEGRAVVRADYAEDRSRIDFAVVYADRPLTGDETAALETSLSLEYGSDKPHRAVVFAVVRLGETLELVDALTVLPQCCCPSEPCGPEI